LIRSSILDPSLSPFAFDLSPSIFGSDCTPHSDAPEERHLC
jgi:hypothetical protein